MAGRKKLKRDFGNFRRKSHPRKRRPVEWLAWITGAVGLASVVLLLLGYGVALSVEGWGEIPSGSLYSSPSELIALSSIAVLRFFDRFSNVEMALNIVLDLLPLTASEAAFAFGVALLVAWPRGERFERAKVRVRETSSRVRTYLSGRTKSRAVVNSLAVGAAVFLFFPLAVFAYWAALLGGALFLTALPIVGYSMGQIYISEYVTGPAGCADGKPGKQRVATCLTVKTKELGEYRGRLVYSTSSVIVLYDTKAPAPFRTVRVPLAEAVVISDLPQHAPTATKTTLQSKK